jgi:hypothetical protein
LPAAALLADLILVAHAGVVLFVVLGQVGIVIGGLRGWAWVRGMAFRAAHLGLIGFIVVQTWLGEHCPLTIWEQQLRRAAGQRSYGESFIEHWLSRLIFYDLPWWVFVTAYTGFALVVAVSWWWLPPRRKNQKGT